MILGINGSPHEGGNTSFALKYALTILEKAGFSTEYISLAGKNITPCDGCFACKSGDCVYADDMVPVYSGLRRCKGLILASPVYMGLVSGQMKIMMDRTVSLRVNGPFDLSGKVGAGIACGGFRNGGQELTLQCMHTFFMQHDMAVIADGPRFSHSGAAIVGKAEEDELGLQTVCNLAEKMARELMRE